MATAEMTLEQFIENTAKGQLFTVDFVKRGDGTIRTMNCRRGVKKGVKGVGQPYDAKSKNLLTVFDLQKLDPSASHNKGKSVEEMEKGAFRNINLDALVGLRMGGKSYDWIHSAQKFVETQERLRA
jgi:hypothetical protein